MPSKNDLLFVVDENNNPLKPQPKSHVHEKNLWHRTSHIWVVNKKKQVLCHQRGILKSVLPGNWVPYFGDHLMPTLSFKNGALDELKKEVGIQTRENDITLYRIYKNHPRKEFQGIFIYQWGGQIEMLSYEIQEIAQLKWFPIPEIKQLLEEKANDWSQVEYGKTILSWLLRQKTSFFSPKV